jgi:hypothetical protein
VTELAVIETEVAPGPEAVVAVVEPFVEALVTRICAEYGARPEEVRALVARLLSGYETARIRAFVPILVEKKLRETYRRPLSSG